MNVLILSAGTRNLVVRYFAKNIDGKTIAADMQRTAPAVYEADGFYLVPRIDAPDYLDCVLDICEKESIDAVVSLIDPELSILAKNKDRLAAAGVTFIGSSYELCELALDKMQMFRWMESHGYRCAKSYDTLEAFDEAYRGGEISFPVFVKPIRGSASESISKVQNREQLDLLWKYGSKLMIQEYLEGQEIGADCYIDLVSRRLVSVFTKYKLRMRSGETDKSVSFKDPALFDLITSFCDDCGWSGVIDIDIIVKDGVYYINEVNPRFGGGYPHAYECGCNFIKRIAANLAGESSPVNIGDYEENIYMMKYNEVRVQKIDE